VLLAQGVPQEQLIPVAGGERIRLGEGVSVRVFPSLHSCVWARKGAPAADEVCVGDLGLFLDEQQARFGEVFEWIHTLGTEVGSHLRATTQGAQGDGGSLVYLIETPEGSLLYQDTSGSWSGVLRGLSPDVAILAAGGRANVDGEPVQGTLADFVAHQARLLGPRQVILSHHDDFLPGFSQQVDAGPIREAMAREAPATTLTELTYLSGHRLFTDL
jgi:L-ascorbate metabolism protein UlaG (beta-lactamase superfamily)